MCPRMMFRTLHPHPHSHTALTHLPSHPLLQLEKCEKERDVFEVETVTLAGQVATLQSDGDKLRDVLDTELQDELEFCQSLEA